MKIKIFVPNDNGKFEFTKEELESLIKEAYDEGYRDSTLSSSTSQAHLLQYANGVRSI